MEISKIYAHTYGNWDLLTNIEASSSTDTRRKVGNNHPEFSHCKGSPTQIDDRPIWALPVRGGGGGGGLNPCPKGLVQLFWDEFA